MTPNSSTPNRRRVIDFQGYDEILIVSPDGDRFPIRVQQAIQGCKIAVDHQLYIEQVRQLYRHLAGWIAERPSITDAFLCWRDLGILFVAVMDSPEFDADLEDELSSLDIEIAREPIYHELAVSSMALPPVSPESALSFLNPKSLKAFRISPLSNG